MGNYLLPCYENKIEEKEILKSNDGKVKCKNLDDFFKSLKPINIYKQEYNILKLKIKKKLTEEITSISNLSSFPCGNIILTTDKGIIYIYDNNLNFVKKEENNKYKELSIKDDTGFITYNISKIKVWEINQKNYILNSLYLIDTKLSLKKVEIIKNGDIIGSTSYDLQPYQCFVYQKVNNNIYQKKMSIKYNSVIISFLITENNKELIILYHYVKRIDYYRIDIYEYNNFKLKRSYKEDCFYFLINDNVNDFLLDVNKNIFCFIHTNHIPTTFRCTRDKIIFYDINSNNKMPFDSEFIFIGSFISPKIEYFSSIKAFIFLSFNLNINYIFNIYKKNIYQKHDVNCDNSKVANFF